MTEDKLIKICDRSVSIHGLYEILEEGDTYKELVKHLKDNPDDNRRPFYNKEFAFRKRYNIVIITSIELYIVYYPDILILPEVLKWLTVIKCLCQREYLNSNH